MINRSTPLNDATVLQQTPINICVVGSGYVGLVVAACFAEIGHTVICVDNDEMKVATLKSGQPLIHEQLLPDLLKRHAHSRLTFTTSLAIAAAQSDVIFIAVGTPSRDNGDVDLSYVEQVVGEIAPALTEYKVIVEKSTVPVGTSDRIRQLLLSKGVNRSNFDIVSNPEFLREGTAVADFLHADRVVVGADSDKAYQLLHAIYAPITSGSYFNATSSVPGPRSFANPVPLLRTSARSSELIKYASNAFLAMKISFINSVANLCEAVNGDIAEVARGIGMDTRIGDKFLTAGLGYGGSCFPKDVKALRFISEDARVNFRLLEEVERINSDQQAIFLSKVRSTLGGLRGKKLGVLGLAFKSGTDDIRESPAVQLVSSFLAEGCSIVAYDPVAMTKAQAVFPELDITYAENPYQTMTGSDALVILTEWPEFSDLDKQEIKKRLHLPIVLDGRNMFDSREMMQLGFTYVSIGRPSSSLPSNEKIPASKKIEKRALVTGAAGFLGSHMVDALLAQGYSVLGVDNLLTGHTRNIEHLSSDSRFSFIEHDISELFDPGHVDLVFNMASPASPEDYATHGVETLLVGSYGTRTALEIAKRYKSKFLQCSTSECYGDPLVHPQPESYWGSVNPIGPRSVYDEAKRFSEALVMAYHRYYGVDTRIARIFNTYGPRLQLNDGRVISNFLKQALSEEEITVYGDGSQTRSFCYVSDQIDGLIRLMFSEEHLPVNIGNPEEFTILQCAKEVLATTGSTSSIVFRPLPQDDPKQRCPDITKAKALLGWEPQIKLVEGLRRSIPWFRERLGTRGPSTHSTDGQSRPKATFPKMLVFPPHHESPDAENADWHDESHNSVARRSS